MKETPHLWHTGRALLKEWEFLLQHLHEKPECYLSSSSFPPHLQGCFSLPAKGQLLTDCDIWLLSPLCVSFHNPHILVHLVQEMLKLSTFTFTGKLIEKLRDCLWQCLSQRIVPRPCSRATGDRSSKALLQL